MKKFKSSILALAALMFVSGCESSQQKNDTSREVVISCGAVGIELEQCRVGAEKWAQQTGNRVRVINAPNNTTDRLANYQLLLAAHSPDIDVYVIDTVWPGIIGDFFIDLKEHYSQEFLSQLFPAFLDNNTVDGRLVAMPWYIDGGLLYYRKDLLEKYGAKVPQTWTELTETAKKIQAAEREAGNERMWGFVFQGRAYEGLTCNALEWIHSWNGGRIVSETGNITVDNPQAANALDLAASWIGTISPRGVLNYQEEESRGVFQSGNAVFHRNWPYVWNLAQAPDSPIRGKVGMTTLPKGGADGQPAATLGGWALAVSKYSSNPKAAISLVEYLTSAKEQKRRAMALGQNPTIMPLYKDPELLRSNPALAELFHIFKSAVPRPAQATGTKYSRVSSEFYEAVHKTLAGRGSAKENLNELKAELFRISRGEKW